MIVKMKTLAFFNFYIILWLGLCSVGKFRVRLKIKKGG
jgi:hypothetical protein